MLLLVAFACLTPSPLTDTGRPPEPKISAPDTGRPPTNRRASGAAVRREPRPTEALRVADRT